MKLDQNICSNNSSAEFENGYDSLKNMAAGVGGGGGGSCPYMALVKTCWRYIIATFIGKSSWNLVRTFVPMKSWQRLKLGHMSSKTRSLGQI